jgi:hypothetical protein
MPTVDGEFGKWIITLGVGGVLAFVMFLFYRKDVRQYTELWKAQTELLMLVVKENTAAHISNSVINQQLMATVNAFHRRVDVTTTDRSVSDLVRELIKPEHDLLAKLRNVDQ